MFRLAFFVEDKNLAKVLVAVQGLALNMEVPQPVVNATVVKGKVAAVREGGYSLINEVLASLSKLKKGTVINSALLKEAIIKGGGQTNSFNYVHSRLQNEGVIRAGKKRGEYVIVQGKGT